MRNPGNVVKAVESFDSWISPWEFASSVSAVLPDPDDGQLFEQVWATACDRVQTVRTGDIPQFLRF